MSNRTRRRLKRRRRQQYLYRWHLEVTHGPLRWLSPTHVERWSFYVHWRYIDRRVAGHPKDEREPEPTADQPEPAHQAAAL